MSRDDAEIEAQIQAKGLTAPRVTQQRINDVIASEHYFTAAEGVLGMLAADGVPPTPYEKANAAPATLRLLTFCVLVLNNGFTVTGESACASPENFDAQIGRDLARQNARQKIWALEGYLLKERLSVPSIHFASAAAGTWLDRARTEHAELVVKQEKLEAFLKGGAGADATQVGYMREQLSYMKLYAVSLAARIRCAEASGG